MISPLILLCKPLINYYGIHPNYINLYFSVSVGNIIYMVKFFFINSLYEVYHCSDSVETIHCFITYSSQNILFEYPGVGDKERGKINLKFSTYF